MDTKESKLKRLLKTAKIFIENQTSMINKATFKAMDSLLDNITNFY